MCWENSCIYRKNQLIYTYFPQNAQKPEDVLPKCSPSWNLISLMNIPWTITSRRRLIMTIVRKNRSILMYRKGQTQVISNILAEVRLHIKMGLKFCTSSPCIRQNRFLISSWTGTICSIWQLSYAHFKCIDSEGNIILKACKALFSEKRKQKLCITKKWDMPLFQF